MPTAKVTFRKLVIDSQNYNSWEPNDDHVVSVISFTLEIDGRVTEDMQVEVRHPYGTEYGETMEVARPTGPSGPYEGPWNHEAFHDLCESYCRSQIGPEGSVIRTNVGSKNARFRNFRVTKQQEGEFFIPG